MKKFTIIVVLILGTILTLITGVVLYFALAISIDLPEITNSESLALTRKKVGENAYTLGNNWLKKNEQGIWEMYLEGDAFERGIAHGKLAQEMVVSQEDIFVAQLKKIIPSETYLKFLKYLILWFNRDIDTFIPEEFKQEIYGVSTSASEKYAFIGSNYERILNYHAAHDIGHALQDKNLVPGCTSFSTWESRSEDSALFIARNFDFYVGDDFANDKIICFINPTTGYKLAFVTWAGFTGVVSGMNEKGLTVTLNASKSDIPSSAAMPISILAREILQYASTIEEAYAIAQKRTTFVSESIMIGSAIDNKTAIIEKSPTKIGLFLSNTNQIACSNHFQSELFTKSDTTSFEQSSVYRYLRLQELLDRTPTINEKKIATILRDQKGLGDKSIGMGNEKALNQLIAHHAVIFNPNEKLFWLSANPFQLGAFVAYNLDSVFSTPTIVRNHSIPSLTIPADSFLQTKNYQNFLLYKLYKKHFLQNSIRHPIDGNKSLLFTPNIAEFIELNPDFYYTYWLVGDYYLNSKKDPKTALTYYKIALTKEVPRLNERDYLTQAIVTCEEKLK